jgi:hypothetical protein
VGPFALTDYEVVVGWAGMMREVVSDGRMPPWSANPEVGHFANDARLSDAEKQLFYSWVDNGCPQGDPADLLAPRQWTDGWRIREPDQVVRMPQPFNVPAEGVVSYQHIVGDPGWKEDKWVQAAEVRPGNRAVVHHIIVFVVHPGGLEGRLRGDAESETGQSAQLKGEQPQGGLRARARGVAGQGGGLTAYVPGSAPSVYKPGVAVFVPKGSKVVFQMHYTPSNSRTARNAAKSGHLWARLRKQISNHRQSRWYEEGP